MNLQGITAPYVEAVNPYVPATVRISHGYTVADDGTQVPAYEGPAAFTAAIVGTTMTVSAVASGMVMPGQTVDGDDVLDDTFVVKQLTGDEGGPGTYTVSRDQDVSSEAMTSALVLRAQVQALTYKDLQQISGINLNGTRRAIYLQGKLDGVVRSLEKGGDLISIASGANAGEWLVGMVLEQWQDWCKVAATLQNGD